MRSLTAMQWILARQVAATLPKRVRNDFKEASAVEYLAGLCYGNTRRFVRAEAKHLDLPYI